MNKFITISLLLSLFPFAIHATDYNTQYQAVQAKIQSIKNQYSEISTCLSRATGEQGSKCLLENQQFGAVTEYEKAILDDFLTPVSDMSILYENKLDDLQQQIFQTKMDYYQQVYNIEQSGGSVGVANGRINNATNAANTKIDAINQQIQFTLQDYQLALASQQTQQQKTCPTNSYYSNGYCYCNNGYIQSGDSCITYTQDCINNFGQNVGGVKGDNNSSCYCNDGYQWNSQQTACIKISSSNPTPSVSEEVNAAPVKNTVKQNNQNNTSETPKIENQAPTQSKIISFSNNSENKTAKQDSTTSKVSFFRKIFNSIRNFLNNIFK